MDFHLPFLFPPPGLRSTFFFDGAISSAAPCHEASCQWPVGDVPFNSVHREYWYYRQHKERADPVSQPTTCAMNSCRDLAPAAATQCRNAKPAAAAADNSPRPGSGGSILPAPFVARRDRVNCLRDFILAHYSLAQLRSGPVLDVAGGKVTPSNPSILLATPCSLCNPSEGRPLVW